MFTSHEEIPALLVSTILSVADANNIASIPLDDINSFLDMMESVERDWDAEADEWEWQRQWG
jgi:hypothetical protein